MSRKAVILKSIGKKYPLMKTPHRGTAMDDFWALKDIDLEVDQGQALGIIGRNGAGKTTLLNVIAGVLSPTKGDISADGRVMGLFNLGVGFQDELSGMENIFLNGAILGAGRKEIENRLDSIIEFSELGNFINMPLGSYSQGMRLRLGFSIIANLDFDILVIDEVLAVGDALFQNKCFERLIDFKRAGKTLIITTQGMDLIERLCDQAMLLDHGSLLFRGDVKEAIDKYRALLNTEKFFVGPQPRKSLHLVEDTKKWADNITDWGKRFGGKEVLIESVEFIDKSGKRSASIKTMDPLKIKVSFAVRDAIKDMHFGIAIFRNDGVYCYGPNTKFDGYRIPELNKGNGYFELSYDKLLLAPGEYKVSVAIWDKNETLAFDYHYGYYGLIVTGVDNANKELISMPLEVNSPGILNKLTAILNIRRNGVILNLGLLADKFGQIKDSPDAEIEHFNILSHDNSKKDIFMTNERVIFSIGLNLRKKIRRGMYLWTGIYRDDGVYCQGVVVDVVNHEKTRIVFPKFSLLPGRYKVSIGIWDSINMDFLTYRHGIYPLKMVFDKHDHGTIFMDHKWTWEAN